MSLGNNKLFKVYVKGVNRGNFARNSSPGVLYVVAKSMDRAYNSICYLYGSDPDYTDIKDFELSNIELVADEANPNTCLTDSYKLIMAEDFYSKFFTDGKFNSNAIKEIIDEEQDNYLDDSDDSDLEEA